MRIKVSRNVSEIFAALLTSFLFVDFVRGVGLLSFFALWACALVTYFFCMLVMAVFGECV